MSIRLQDHLAELEDPRSGNATLHPLLDILLVAVCGALSGADSWTEVETYGEAKEDFLNEFLDLPHGIPSHDTFTRVFRHIDPDAFTHLFTQWSAAMSDHTTEAIAIDGKTLRRSYDRSSSTGALTMVNAWAREAHLVLGQVAARDGENEIHAIREILELLALEGSVVTIDAIGCQKSFAETIIGKDADYVFTLKRNQRGLYQEVEEHFNLLLGGLDPCQSSLDEVSRQVDCSVYETVEKGHGRWEQRRYYVSDDLSKLRRDAPWRGLRSVVMVERVREVDGERTRERRYFITSLPADAARLAEAVRGHWQVENSLHWVLDVTFAEDRSRVRKGHGAFNFGVLRRLATNLLAQETDSGLPMSRKRLRAGWDNDYLKHVLGF